jgi:membrane protein involved in D-alanine export
MVLLGLVQKFVLAEAINRYLLSPLNTESTSLSEMLSNMYVYAFYLYFDFAGYSSLAAGFAKLIGINVPQNFNNPFVAVNPQDFWRRWHASLSDWLRDYLFRPYYKWISGKEKLKPYPLLKQNSGLFLTFLVMGLWNGFKSNYILSGVLFGVYSVVHNTYVVRSRQAGRDIVFGSLNEVAVKWISVFLMFNLACIALYVFSGRCPLL